MREIQSVDIPIRQLVVGLKRDYFGYLQQLIDQYGSLFSLPFRPHPAIVVSEPDIVNHILISNKDNYIKGADINGTAYHYLKAAMGDNILLTDNKKKWDKHRKIVMPTLQRSHYAAYAEKMTRNCQNMLNDWEQQRNNNQPINATHSIEKFALLNLLDTLLKDGDFDVEGLLHVVQQWNIGHNAANTFKSLTQLLHQLVYDYVKKRIQAKTDQHDVLSGLIAAYQDEIETEQAILTICEETKGILLAGHDTLAAALTWACYLLSKAPDVQMQIKEECHDVFGKNPPTYETLDQIPFTVATFKESLRLYPPIYNIPRFAVNDDVVNDINIPKNSYIMIPVFHIQRNKKYWPDPEVFQPERFLEDDLTYQLQAYLPFSIGERSCIGREFAMMEATITIAMMLSRYQISMAENRVLTLGAVNSLWPKEDLELNIKSIEN